MIDNAIVKSEMIESLAVSKLASGVIDTSKIQIQATNGHMTIADNTIRFIDSKGNTRLYMGEDSNGNFSYQVYNANGSGLLLDENGLKEIAITDGLIKTNMINDQAITGDKINWTSYCESFNSSTNTSTLDSAHITMDGKRLDTAFNQLNTTIQGQTETINTHSTQLTQNANAIQGLVTATTITKEDGKTVGIKDENANMKLTQDSFQVSISEKVDNIQIGGTNLLSGTKLLTDGIASPSYITSDTYLGFKIMYHKGTTDEPADTYIFGGLNVEPNTEYTLSFYAKGKGYLGSFFWPDTVSYGRNSNGETTNNADGNINTTVTSEWKRYWVTWKTLPDVSGKKNVIVSRIYKGNEIYICGVKFEKGNKATEWTPSPGDVDSNINNAKQEAITSANKTLNSTIANYYTKSHTDSQINVAKEAINLGVSTTYETK